MARTSPPSTRPARRRYAARVPAAVEYVGGSVTSPGAQRPEAEARADAPWIQQYNGRDHGYAMLAVDGERMVTEYRSADLTSETGAVRTGSQPAAAAGVGLRGTARPVARARAPASAAAGVRRRIRSSPVRPRGQGRSRQGTTRTRRAEGGTTDRLDPQIGRISAGVPLYGHRGTPSAGNVVSMDALVVDPQGAPAPLPYHGAGQWSGTSAA